MRKLDILHQIEEDIKNKIKVTRGYNTTPVEVKRGWNKWNDFQIKPVVCFANLTDEADENVESGDDSRWLNLVFYGFADTDGMGNTDKIHELAEDVENFLFSDDFTYTDNTLVGNTETKEGGVSDPINSFLMEVKIEYDRLDT